MREWNWPLIKGVIYSVFLGIEINVISFEITRVHLCFNRENALWTPQTWHDLLKLVLALIRSDWLDETTNSLHKKGSIVKVWKIQNLCPIKWVPFSYTGCLNQIYRLPKDMLLIFMKHGQNVQFLPTFKKIRWKSRIHFFWRTCHFFH